METIPQDHAAAVDAVRSIDCPECWALAGEACGFVPAGDHFARWAEARRRGLITAGQAGAALDLLPVITNGAVVPDVTR